jgi:hypothetical protein
MPPVRGGAGYDSLGGSGIPDRKGDDAAVEEEQDGRDFESGTTKKSKSLLSRGAAASYVVVPIYSSSSSDTSAGSTTATATSSTTFQESTVLGRQELATLWWQHCRNHCQAHLRAKTTRRRPCTRFCQPLRDNVRMLSRKLIVLQHHQVSIHNECRFPNLVTIVSSRTDHNRQHHPPPTTNAYPASSSSTYILSLGGAPARGSCRGAISSTELCECRTWCHCCCYYNWWTSFGVDTKKSSYQSTTISADSRIGYEYYRCRAIPEIYRDSLFHTDQSILELVIRLASSATT